MKKVCECGILKARCRLHASDGVFCECNILKSRCRLHAPDVKVVIARQMHYNSKRNDAAYSRENDMTLKYLVSMFNDRDEHFCPYCNVMMDLRPTRLSKEKALTLQRKDNRIGHVKSNVIFCCHGCNSGRVEKKIHLCAGEACTERVDALGMRCRVH